MHDSNVKSVAILGATTTFVARSGQLELIIAGLLVAAVAAPGIMEIMMKHVKMKSLDDIMEELIEDMPKPIELPDPRSVAGAVATFVAAGLAAQQSFARAQTLGKLLGIPPGKLSNSPEALRLIKLTVAALVGSRPSPPRCKDMENTYNTHFARANNAWRGGGMLPNIWSNFFDATIDYVRCVLGIGGGPPQGPAPA